MCSSKVINTSYTRGLPIDFTTPNSSRGLELFLKEKSACELASPAPSKRRGGARDHLSVLLMERVAVEKDSRSEGEGLSERSCDEEGLVECREVVLFSTDQPDDVIISLDADMSWY